jgi:farnesyl diphosphate synthase
MGEYFQIQDDYLDCYGDPEITGKIGTDIEDNKCSWLIVQAIAKATPEQKAILEANYGRRDAKYVACVKNLYAQLHIKEIFEQYEEECYEKLMSMIDSLVSLPKSLFIEFCERIFKRKK